MTYYIELVMSKSQSGSESPDRLYYLRIGICHCDRELLDRKPTYLICELLYMEHHHLYQKITGLVLSALHIDFFLPESLLIYLIYHSSVILKSIGGSLGANTPSRQIYEFIALSLCISYSLVICTIEHNVRKHISVLCLLVIHRLRLMCIGIIITKLCIFRSKIQTKIQLCVSHICSLLIVTSDLHQRNGCCTGMCPYPVSAHGHFSFPGLPAYC